MVKGRCVNKVKVKILYINKKNRGSSIFLLSPKNHKIANYNTIHFPLL